MKKIILFMLLSFTISYGQVGINTTAPTKTLDVNGETKVRILNDIAVSSLDTNKIVVSNNDGTLGVSSLKSLLGKEGLLLYGSGTWSGIRISNSSDLIFSGELPCGETFGLEFQYIPGSGHVTVLAKTNNISFAETAPHNFSLSATGCGPYILTFIPAAGGFYDLSSPDGVKGTISSVAHNY